MLLQFDTILYCIATTKTRVQYRDEVFYYRYKHGFAYNASCHLNSPDKKSEDGMTYNMKLHLKSNIKWYEKKYENVPEK